MRILLSVVGGLLLASGVVSVNLWQKLSAERELTNSLREQLTEATGRVRAPATPAPPNSTAPPTVAAASVPAATPVAPPQLVALTSSNSNQADLWKDPEYRKARLAQARTSLLRQYADLAEELGLTEAEATKVIDLLAEFQVNMNAELNTLSANDRNDPSMQQEIMRRQLDMQRQRDSSLTALIGPRFGQFQQFQQSLPARSRVTSMNSTLSAAGLSMSSAQAKSLIAVVAAEQRRQQQDMEAMTRNVNAQDPEARAKVTEQLRNRNADTNRRVLESAAPILSPQQVSALRTEFEQQEAVNRASNRVRERALGARGQLPPPAPAQPQ